MSETITQYEQYPRSQFPGQVDNWDNMQDINSVTADAAIEYNTLIQEKKYTEAATYLSNHPELDKILFNAQKFNQLTDGIKAVQQFFKDDVEKYINSLSNTTIGINDNLKFGDGASVTNTYSAYKINFLLAPEILTEPFNVNELLGNDDSCSKLYCWSAEVGSNSKNLPTDVTSAILRTTKASTFVSQMIYANGVLFYRFTDKSDISTVSWTQIPDPSHKRFLTATFTSGGWVGEVAPYTQTVEVIGLKESDNPVLVKEISKEMLVDDIKKYNIAYGVLSAGSGSTNNDSLTWICLEKPEIDITIGLKGV